MLFRLTHSLPNKCLVAVSGGVDSMCAAHWLLTANKERVQGIVHVNHGTPFSDKASSFVGDYFTSRTEGPVFCHHILPKIPEGQSKEAYWREKRYEVFKDRAAWEDLPIALAHNFDDCVEEYIMCTMVRGREGTIPYQHGPCIRPFRLWKRGAIVEYAQRHKIPYVEDPSNVDILYKRNYVRHVIAPKVANLNPGIYKIVEKTVKKQDEFDGNVGDL